MKVNELADHLETFSTWLDLWFIRAGCAVLFATMLIAVANMALRPVGFPITGSFELMGMGCAITAALGLSMAQAEKSHIAVNILFRCFPQGLRKFLSTTGSIMCALLFSAAAWRLFQTGLTQLKTGEVSETLRIPFYPVIWVVATGFASLAMRLVVEATKTVAGWIADSPEP